MKKILSILLLCAPFLFIAFGIAKTNTYKPITLRNHYEDINNISDIEKSTPEIEFFTDHSDNKKQNKLNTNILILGVDSRKGEKSRADVIILLNIKEDNVNLISIPRDALIHIEGKGKSKINASYAYGGIKLCKKTIERLLDTNIDNYIVFNFKAVEKGVNALGGFIVTIPKDIRISDPELKKNFLLKKGSYKLNGIQTLEYLRYRNDGKGDIGRIYRQQQFIKDLQQSFLKLENIPLIPNACLAIRDEIKTDMGVSDMASYFINGYRLRNKFEYHTLNGYSKTINKVSYYILYESSIKNIINIIK